MSCLRHSKPQFQRAPARAAIHCSCRDSTINSHHRMNPRPSGTSPAAHPVSRGPSGTGHDRASCDSVSRHGSHRQTRCGASRHCGPTVLGRQHHPATNEPACPRTFCRTQTRSARVEVALFSESRSDGRNKPRTSVRGHSDKRADSPEGKTGWSGQNFCRPFGTFGALVAP